MIYADYSFYSGTFGGTLPEAKFNSAALIASSLIDGYTHDRAEKFYFEHGDKLKLACCAVAERISCGNAVRSASNDGYSETYDVSKHGLGRDAFDIALMYLGDTGLMYAGVQSC